MTGRDLGRAQEAAAKIGGEGFALDVRSEDSVRACADAAWERLGGIDLLVLNAGIGQRTVNPRFLTDPEPFWRAEPDAFRAVVDTKVNGTFLAAREVVPRMLAAGGGRVVVISMNESTMTRPGFAPYGPSGAAVEALARVMAGDLEGTSVTLNILLPGGPTDTGMIPPGVPERGAGDVPRPGGHGPADRVAGVSRRARRADRRDGVR